MSLADWKDEFYPHDAEEATEEDAVEHSLRKWEGLRPENLKKHKVHTIGSDLEDDEDDYLDIDWSTCALCRVHSTSGDMCGEDEDESCGRCPLQAVLEGPHAYGCKVPYQIWLESHDPLPMIEALKLAQAYEKKGEDE